jgi:hypothetical protein
LNLTIQISLPEEQVAALKSNPSPADLSEFLVRCKAPSAAGWVDGFRKSQKGDVYEASRSFSKALSSGDPLFESTLSCSGKQFSVQIRRRKESGDRGEEERTAVRVFVEQACEEAGLKGNGKIPPVVEALGLALAREFCITGRHDEANQLVRRLLMISRQSIYLRSSEQAIGYLLRREVPPPHLEKFIGVDRDVLRDRFCPVPFARADVHQGGEAVMCCTHWLPTTIGNVFNGNANQILNSEVAKSIRRSVVDGSFKYCSHADCELIVNDKLPRKNDYLGKDFDDDYYHIDQEILRKAFVQESFDIPNVSYLVFCLDRSCNLTCPSCRTHLILVKGEERDRLYDVNERSVLPMLKNAKRVMVNPSGEAFASKPSIQLLEALKRPGYENVIVDIITNGTVCDQQQWDKFSHLFGRINIVRVSVDGASKEVIERLRRGRNTRSW